MPLKLIPSTGQSKPCVHICEDNGNGIYKVLEIVYGDSYDQLVEYFLKDRRFFKEIVFGGIPQQDTV